MREFVAIFSISLGFLLWAFAVPARRPKRWVGLRVPERAMLLAGWGGFALSAIALWPHGASGAGLFTLTGGCAVATLFTLGVPVLLRPPGVAAGAPRGQRRAPIVVRPFAIVGAVLALVGTAPGAILLGLGLALRLPFELETRVAIGFGSIFALWLAAVCLVWLIRSPARAFAWCLAFAALGGLLVGRFP